MKYEYYWYDSSKDWSLDLSTKLGIDFVFTPTTLFSLLLMTLSIKRDTQNTPNSKLLFSSPHSLDYNKHW